MVSWMPGKLRQYLQSVGPTQVSLSGSGVPHDSPVEDHLLWDLALIMPGLARSYLSHFALFFSLLAASMRQDVGPKRLHESGLRHLQASQGRLLTALLISLLDVWHHLMLPNAVA